MEDQSDSWLKLSRSILTHPIFCDCPHSWFRVWIALLASANWATRKRYFGTKEITVQPGQIICSVDWLRKIVDVSVKQTRAALAYLKTANAITIETASHGTIITITNWERYQGRDWYEGQTKGQTEGQTEGKPRANEGQTKGKANRKIEGIEQTNTTPKTASANGWRAKSFAEFWSPGFVWAKIGRGAAKRAYERAAKTPELARLINQAARDQGPGLLAEAERQQRTVLHPATWLNQERWADETDESEPAPDYSQIKHYPIPGLFAGLDDAEETDTNIRS